MDKSENAFGRRVREARESLRWSQRDLAERFGCDQKTISNIERGKTTVGVDDLPRLARILGKDVLYFYPAFVLAPSSQDLQVRLGGLLADPDVEALIRLLLEMSAEKRAQVCSYARFLAEHDRDL